MSGVASTPPWGDDQLFLVPLSKKIIKQLMDAGLITPTPQSTY